MKKEKTQRLRALEEQGNEYIRITERMVIQFPYIFQAKFDNFEMVLVQELHLIIGPELEFSFGLKTFLRVYLRALKSLCEFLLRV